MIRLKDSNVGKDFSSAYFNNGIINKGVKEQIASEKTKLLQNLKQEL